MAIDVNELIRWARTLPDDADVAIDDGGLSLVEVDGDAYLEVGGLPLENEES
jgi:hypothetical protein